ncbi:hypothetical protein [Luedemannella helvata]
MIRNAQNRSGEPMTRRHINDASTSVLRAVEGGWPGWEERA